jgi:hypothetical protein
MNKSEFSEKINLDELYNRKNEVESNRIKIYQKILHRVHTKIKITSRQKISEQYCFFLIPEFLIGVPRFDSATCTAYVIDKLMDNGFHVKYTHPNMLFISWKHYIDKKQRALYKKNYGISINGFGEEIKNKREINMNNPTDLNSLIVRKDKNVKLKIKDQKNYKSISTYKPTGNLIYNTSLLKTIQEEIKK